MSMSTGGKTSGISPFRKAVHSPPVDQKKEIHNPVTTRTVTQQEVKEWKPAAAKTGLDIKYEHPRHA